MARNGLTKVIYKGTFVSKQSLSRMTLGKTVNSTFWVLLLFVRRVLPSCTACKPACLAAKAKPALQSKKGESTLQCIPKQLCSDQRSLALLLWCWQGRAPSTMGQQSKAAAQCTASQWRSVSVIARHFRKVDFWITKVVYRSVRGPALALLFVFGVK